MSKSKEQSIERKMAAELFNKTWDLIDKKDRSHSDDVNMINSAHARADGQINNDHTLPG